VTKSETFLKSKRGGIAVRGKGRGKGKGDNLYRPPALRSEFSGGRPCRDFARSGSCPRGARCTYLHAKIDPTVTDKADDDALHRHCEVANAHTNAITAIAMTEQGIYTASQDKTLKRWKPSQDSTGRYQLTKDLEVPLDDSCYSMYCMSGWIFCGLWNGTIKAFSQEGGNFVMTGHTKRVTAIKEHSGVLITGGADREVRLWQPDQGTKTFKCTHTISESMPGSIHCLHVLGGNLWIGGMSGIAMCNLTDLKVTKLLPPVKPVNSFLEFQGHVIAAYGDASLRIFDAEGTMKSEMQNIAAGPIQRIAGLDRGPRVLCGHSYGQVTTIVLPDFIFKTQFQAFLDTSIESVLCPGDQGLFLLGSKTGSLQLWQRVQP